MKISNILLTVLGSSFVEAVSLQLLPLLLWRGLMRGPLQRLRLLKLGVDGLVRSRPERTELLRGGAFGLLAILFISRQRPVVGTRWN